MIANLSHEICNDSARISWYFLSDPYGCQKCLLAYIQSCQAQQWGKSVHLAKGMPSGASGLTGKTNWCLHLSGRSPRKFHRQFPEAWYGLVGFEENFKCAKTFVGSHWEILNFTQQLGIGQDRVYEFFPYFKKKINKCTNHLHIIVCVVCLFSLRLPRLWNGQCPSKLCRGTVILRRFSSWQVRMEQDGTSTKLWMAKRHTGLSGVHD